MRILSLFLFAFTSAHAAEESVATTSAKAWGAELSAELATAAARPDTGRSYAYVISGGPSFDLGSDWSLSAKSEAELVRGAERSGEWKDSLLSVKKAGMRWGIVSLAVKGVILLPTNRSEREAGMSVAPAAGFTVEFEPIEGLGLAYSTTGTRYLRSGEKAAAYDGTRWKAKQEVSANFRIYRRIGLNAASSHEAEWKWNGGRGEQIELIQAVTYARGAYSFAVGHKAKTETRQSDGTRNSVALFRSPESQVFGNVTVTL